jgi:prolyl-tRNA editing enzyme YbaK/EbsC (Cys-tRNA(Pro) deacylase)
MNDAGPTSPQDDSVLDAIRALLAEHGAEWREVHHPPTRTSEEAAAARGESMQIGGKAIVAKVGSEFRLFVFSAARRMVSRLIRKHQGEQRFRFATAGELRELTGLVPGCVPPFGRPILPLDLHVDTSIMENDRIAFNAGSLTDSIIMDRRVWLEIARPADIFPFSKRSPHA